MSAQIRFKIFRLHKYKTNKLKSSCIRHFNISTLKRGLHFEKFDASRIMVNHLLRWIYPSYFKFETILIVHLFHFSATSEEDPYHLNL